MTSLSPAVVAAIDDLELAARLVVEGLRVGHHRSPFRGHGGEFTQHRPYRSGDDLKYLDWKLFGRSDRLFTRQFRETTNVAVMIVLDTSASMDFPATGLSKFRYGCIISAALAHLVSTQGNSVGLMTMTADRLAYVPSRGGRPHLRSVIARIDNLVPGGAWNPPAVIARGAELLQRRGLVVVISDFYDHEEGTRRELRHVVQRGHDVAMLQLVSPAERTLTCKGQVEFEDLESGERRLIDATSMNDMYERNMQDFLDRCRVGASRDGIEYALISTDTAPERALRDFLLRRSLSESSPHAFGAIEK
ncbi:MAG: DUF58 domain-containing protein [Gemmatimonadota bacterium]|nr:DUF58 domain-containing protein [Gemmatimonadota bacterium]